MNTEEIQGIAIDLIEKTMAFKRKPVKPHSSYSYNEDFKTIRIALPRGMGNSEIALRLLLKYENSVLIVGNLRDNVFSENKRNKVFTAYNRIFSAYQTRLPQRAELVLVDIPTYVKASQIDHIYQIHAPFYVFLG